MKWYHAAAMAVLAANLAFAQQPVKGAGGSSASSAPPAPMTDPGAVDSMQVKSVGQILQENPQLAQTMKAMLPSDITPEQACSGYNVFEECLSSIHLAKDINISFPALKADTTGKHRSGLEKAVQHLAPSVNAKDAVKAARKAAAQDMKGISLFG